MSGIIFLLNNCTKFCLRKKGFCLQPHCLYDQSSLSKLKFATNPCKIYSMMSILAIPSQLLSPNRHRAVNTDSERAAEFRRCVKEKSESFRFTPPGSAGNRYISLSLSLSFADNERCQNSSALIIRESAAWHTPSNRVMNETCVVAGDIECRHRASRDFHDSMQRGRTPTLIMHLWQQAKLHSLQGNGCPAQLKLQFAASRIETRVGLCRGRQPAPQTRHARCINSKSLSFLFLRAG